jgi:hypothetical protein
MRHDTCRLPSAGALLLAGACLLAGPGVSSAAPSDAARGELRGLIENVTQATRRYAATDSAGRTMDTAKILQDGTGGYLAVYHTYVGGVVRASVATSSDLLNWTFRRELGLEASQPHMVALPDGAFVVAWEQEPGNHLAFRYYASRAALLAGNASRSFDAPRHLSGCAEGTPNIYSVTLSPDIDHSTIDVGGHYFWNCDRDRQMRGTLTNFNAWTVQAQPAYDNALLHWGVGGNIGDRDAVRFRGFTYSTIEGQFVKGDFGSWRSFVYDHQTGNADPLDIRTDGGSTAFANPTITDVRAPDGRSALVVSLFLPSEGARSGEAGQLIYYRPYGTSVPNLALNRPATADSSCNGNEGPAKAVNGSTTAGNGDKWCSLGGSKWMRVDLGGVTTVGRVVVKHAAAGGELAAWNTRDFSLQVSPNGSTWSTVASIGGNTAAVTSLAFAGRSARYVRLNITTPSSNGSAAARIYELEVYER